MPKFALAIALFCATAFVEECTSEKPSFSRHMTIIKPKSTSLPMGNQLYTVSIGHSNVHVNSSDESHKPCDIAIDPAKKSIAGEMKVIASDTMIYILGQHSIERIDEKDRVVYSLMMINPRDCTLKSPDVSDVYPGWRSPLPTLIVNGMGVDVYFSSMKTCAPCRFNNEGMKEKNVPPLNISAEGDRDSYDIRKFGPNYLFVQTIHSRKVIMKSLDGQNMNVLKEKQVDYPINTIANTKADTMGYCSKEHDHMLADIIAYREINCERMNSKLETQHSINLQIRPYPSTVSRVSYDIDEKGEKSYIGFARNKNLRVDVYDMSGQPLKSYDLGEVNARFQNYPDYYPLGFDAYTYWDVRGYIMGKEYCLVTEQVTHKYPIEFHDVRCINI